MAESSNARFADSDASVGTEQLVALDRLSDAVGRADRIEQIYEAALDALTTTLGAERAAVLLVDPDGVMRFKAWRRLSEGYRRAVEGHSPWPADASDPQPVLVADAERDPALAPWAPTIRAEGIRALAFIPLTVRDRLLGKFMVYFDTPHAFLKTEVRMAGIIARHIAFAIERQHTVEALRSAEARQVELARVLDGRIVERTHELDRSHEELLSFMHTMSHDLRAPLRAIRGYMDTLVDERGEAMGEVGRMYAERVAEATERMNRLIADLLDYGRVGRKDIALGPVAVASAVRAAIDELHAELDRTGTQVALDGDTGACVRGHWPTLCLALRNLLQNAVTFVAPGTPPAVQVRVRNGGDRVRVTVEDNGIGIAPAYHARIFEVFERLHTAPEYPGTGIGLAVVRRCVERMDGTLGVDSQVGCGSRFWIELAADGPGAT